MIIIPSSPWPLSSPPGARAAPAGPSRLRRLAQAWQHMRQRARQATVAPPERARDAAVPGELRTLTPDEPLWGVWPMGTRFEVVQGQVTMSLKRRLLNEGWTRAVLLDTHGQWVVSEAVTLTLRPVERAVVRIVRP